MIIAEENIDKSKSPLARLFESYPGKDQIICSAKVKTITSELLRPVAKLCLLEQES